MADDLYASPGGDAKSFYLYVDYLGAKLETEWLARNGKVNYTSEFLENGVCVHDLDPAVAEALKGFHDDSLRTSFRVDDALPGYFAPALGDDTIRRINAENTYFTSPSSKPVEALEAFLESVRSYVENQFGYTFRVTNVRAWRCRPGSDFGPNGWHNDGPTLYLRKILIYVNPPNPTNGTIQVVTRKGQNVTLDRDKPTWVLVDADALVHRGRPSPTIERPIIEITLFPSEIPSVKPVFAGQNARVPLPSPQEYEEALSTTGGNVYKPVSPSTTDRLKTTVRSALGLPRRLAKGVRDGLIGRPPQPAAPPKRLAGDFNINIGGGPRFNHAGWRNLESVPSPANPFGFKLHPQARFPVPSGTVETVYSSHCLEHLDDATVERVLSEARRVVHKDGRLVLKLPDYEKALACWKARDESFFAGKWGFETVNWSWPARQVADGLDSWASMVFCGFWNEAYGDHFGRAVNRGPGAYHGPAVQTAKLVPELLTLDSPHEIARRLRESVLADEGKVTFNHQNAWSRAELTALLASAGFKVVSQDEAEVIEKAASVPLIEQQRDVSMYCLALPA